MNTPNIPTPTTKKYKHLFFGLVILLSGIIIGFSGGIFFTVNNMHFFQPTDKRIAKHLFEHITDDYPDINISQKKLNKILRDNLESFHLVREEAAYKINKIQQEIAEEIAEFIPDDREKKRWMKSYIKYFPGHERRERKAERYRKHRPEDFGRPPPPPPHPNEGF